MHISRLFSLVSRRRGEATLVTRPSALGTIAATAALALAAASASAQSAAINPYTYIGRVMDATHAAFGTNRVATLNAYDSAGTRLSTSRTFFLADSRCNYRLIIPLADSDVAGYSRPGAVLTISVDDGAKVWSGVVVDAGRASGTVVGEPGGVHEVDIVLGEDANGDGIDDALYARLKAEWEDSDYWDPEAGFDTNADHDGDGVSTIGEAYAGTNPFKASSAIRITAFELNCQEAGGTKSKLVFTTAPGRAYSVESAPAVTGAWEKVSFFLDPDAAGPVNVISRPAGPSAVPATIYLLPTPERAASFFRVKSE